MVEKLLTAIFLSDLHGNLPDPKAIQGADYLILGGDTVPIGATGIEPLYGAQYNWYKEVFEPWLVSTGYDRNHIIGISGNHEFVATLPWGERMLRNLSWIYLKDQAITLDNGQVLFGSPWSVTKPSRQPLAFQTYNDAGLKKHWDKIPYQCDILLSHTPVHGYVDVAHGAGSVGSVSLLEHLQMRRPDIHTVLTGHIHEAHGFKYDKRLYINGSRTTKAFQAKNTAWHFVLDPTATKAKPVKLKVHTQRVWLDGISAERQKQLTHQEGLS